MYWNYTDADSLHADTTTLSARRPWYSLEYNDDISGLALQPWSMTELESFVTGHQVGQKQGSVTQELLNYFEHIIYWLPIGMIFDCLRRG